MIKIIIVQKKIKNHKEKLKINLKKIIFTMILFKNNKNKLKTYNKIIKFINKS